MTDAIIHLNNVHKSFGDKNVICGIDAKIQAGEVVALLGVNGAGKTTMINMILGIEEPSNGEILLFGGNPKHAKNRQKIGATPQNTEFPETLKVKEVLELIAKHYDNPIPLEQAASQFSLTDILDQLCGGLSGGQKRRVALALAFMGKPECVFLDEPTTGLDVESRQKVWRHIQDYVKQGGSLFLTTHYLEEAEALATRVLILENGKISKDGSVNEIKKLAGLARIIFNGASVPSNLKHIEKSEHAGDKIILHTHNTDALIREIVSNNIAFENLEIKHNSLEQAFIMMAEENHP